MLQSKLTPSEFSEIAAEIIPGVAHLLPELILTVVACALIVSDLLIKRSDSRFTMGILALSGLVAAFFYAIDGFGESQLIFGGMVTIDPFSAFFKAIFIGSTAIVVIFSMLYEPFRGRRMGEYFAIMLCAVVGMCLMASASNLLMFYLSLEMVSILSYILVVFLRQSRAGSEASLKYVIYGSVASGLMIFGLSIFYGLTGSTDLAAIGMAFETSTDLFTLSIASVLVLAGFAYKMSVVPMHFWCPDVYEGAPTPITAWLSVASKAAGFAMFVRFLVVGFSGPLQSAGVSLDIEWTSLVAGLSFATMTLGNLAALWQESAKRLLAYSSIAHAGYLMMGVALFQQEGFPGFQPVAFYFLVYLFMNLGAFGVVIFVENRLGTDRLEDYKGLGYRAPFLAFMLTIFLISLIGLPPTGGFTGKFQLIAAAVKGDLLWLAIAAGVNTAISLWYYARIIRRMYLESMDDVSPLHIPLSAKVMTAALAIPMIYLGIFFEGAAKITQGLTIFGAP
ncbi:MAG: NADH-quinone oxidoreductase subunit N [Planctomycetota bacterium]|nr:NADH-quinone oxidoreductase subunit N [Planctomycetota bacterium]